MSDVVHERAV